MLAIALDPNFSKPVGLSILFAGGPERQVIACRGSRSMNGVLDLSSETSVLTVATDRVQVGNRRPFGRIAGVWAGRIAVHFRRATTRCRLSRTAIRRSMSGLGRETFDAQRASATRTICAAKFCGSSPKTTERTASRREICFPADGSPGRPEIYTMGHRNPYRISIDPETGWLYWGEVGPDAQMTIRPTRGPRGYDEINQAREAGNYGWPYIIADNKAYYDYDFAAGVSGPAFNPAAPLNNSPNNTGESIAARRAGIHLVSLRRQQRIPGTGQRWANGDGRARLSIRSGARLGHQAARILRRHADHVRLVAPPVLGGQARPGRRNSEDQSDL